MKLNELDYLLVGFTLAVLPTSLGNHDAKRLYDDLMRKSGYNALIRPVGNSTAKLTVKLLLKLSQLIDVDEKNEIISLNVWVIHVWDDVALRWDPSEYGGVSQIYVPSELIWLPDVVLYNNGDGDYQITLMTKATISYTGEVRWEPPAIYKAQCDIDVKYFPFDQQTCKFKLGSWTYDGLKVDLQHLWTEQRGLHQLDVIDHAIDITDFYKSVEWDIMAVPAKKTNKYYPCCEEPYPDITFNITIRRKTLFYTINLIIPCIAINLLTVLTFYLPSDSGEKISLCISILLSLSIFQLLLMEIVPATSITVPLMLKYILFTMIMVSLSVFISVVTLNVRFRSAGTHEMSKLTRMLFFQILPRFLFMDSPGTEVDVPGEDADFDFDDQPNQSDLARLENPFKTSRNRLNPSESNVDQIYGDSYISSSFIGARPKGFQSVDFAGFCKACSSRKWDSNRKYPPNVLKALDGTSFVAKHLKDDDQSQKVKDEWKYIALVIDRIFLLIYIVICLFGGLGLFLNNPMLYDNRQPIS